MTLHTLMHQLFLRDLFATARGRAFVLSQAADAESGGEAKLFDVLLEKVHDPDLHRMVKKHREDEIRHAEMYAACAARQGAKLPEIPPSLKVIDTIDRHLTEVRDGVSFFDEKVHDDRWIVDGYLFLQVLEERAVEQFGTLAGSLRPFDPRSAAIVTEVAADERRHLLYCDAVTKKYAPDANALAARLDAFRRAEAIAYREHTQKSLEFLLGHGFLPSRTKTLFWRGVASASTYAELPWTDLRRAA
jgi:rubrerythrin